MADHRDLIHDPDFPALQSWIIQNTGLSYYEDKAREMVEAIGRCYQGAAPGTAKHILRRIADPGNADLDALVEQLTIGETFFFRHLEMFEALRHFVFPDLLRRKAPSRSITIWCAGCSIGAEPYSIAIMLHHLLADKFAEWDIHILGTDINRQFLRVAREATYEPWAMRGVPPEILEKCFEPAGRRWTVKPYCRRGVRFQFHNLVRDPFPSVGLAEAGLDLIICRNVMIYFDKAGIQRLVEGFHNHLIPGGWLAVGHSEPHTEIFRAFHTINAPGAVLYQKPSRDAPPREAATNWALGGSTPPVAVNAPVAMTALPIPRIAPVPKVTQAFPETTRLSPQSGASQLQKVRALADGGQLGEAREACETLAAEDSLNPDPHYLLGVIHYHLGQWGEAHQALRRCIYLKRDYILAHYYMGLVRASLGHSGDQHFRNTRALLEGLAPDEALPMGDGLTVADLHNLMALQIGELKDD